MPRSVCAGADGHVHFGALVRWLSRDGHGAWHRSDATPRDRFANVDADDRLAAARAALRARRARDRLNGTRSWAGRHITRYSTACWTPFRTYSTNSRLG